MVRHGKKSHQSPTNQPKPASKNGPTKKTRAYQKSQFAKRQELSNQLNNFVAQISSGYIPVANPGALKHSDETVAVFDTEVALSYDNQAPCPDKNCVSKDCKTHFSDLVATKEAADPNVDPVPTPPSSPPKDDGENGPPSSKDKITLDPRDNTVWFSRPVAGQYGFWSLYGACVLLLFLAPTLSFLYNTHGRHTPEVFQQTICTPYNFTLPSRWASPLVLYDYTTSLASNLYCNITGQLRQDYTFFRQSLMYYVRYVVGWPLYDRAAPYFRVSKFLPVPMAALALIAGAFVGTCGRRSFFKVKFRLVPGLMVMSFLLPSVVYNSWKWSGVPVQYDYCPSCPNAYSRFSFPFGEAGMVRLPDTSKMVVEALEYDLDLLLNRIAAALIVLLLVSFGPDYRLYYICKRIESNTSFDDKFDHNKRGEKDREQHPDMAKVHTHLTHPLNIFRRPWITKISLTLRNRRYNVFRDGYAWCVYLVNLALPQAIYAPEGANRPQPPKASAPASKFTTYSIPYKWTQTPRDIMTVSLELLRQACNPSSFSPTIDLEMATDRINRSAVNNQNVNISRYTLTEDTQHVYGDTVRLALVLRDSLFSRADRLTDFIPLQHPP